jgi:hypothetical protein
MRGVSRVLCACLVVAAGDCGKIERRSDADQARGLVAAIVREPDVRRLERALSADSASRLAKFDPEEREEYLAKAVRQLDGYTDAEIRVTRRTGERRFTVGLRKPEAESICLAVEPNRDGTPALDLSASIDDWAATIAWSRSVAKRMSSENAGRPLLTIGGIEMLTTFEPEIFRFGMDVSFASCGDDRAGP